MDIIDLGFSTPSSPPCDQGVTLEIVENNKQFISMFLKRINIDVTEIQVIALANSSPEILQDMFTIASSGQLALSNSCDKMMGIQRLQRVDFNRIKNYDCQGCNPQKN